MASGEEQPWNRIKSGDNETSEEIRQSESSGPIMPSSAEDLIRDIYNE